MAEAHKPYFLSRIDDWHSNRLERILTPETKNRIANLFIEVVEENPINEQKDSKISREEIEIIAGDIKSGYREFFSKIYLATEKIIKGIVKLNTVEREACLIDLIEACKDLLKFPSLVQKRAESLDPIGKEELDIFFLQSYQNSRRFIETYLNFQDAQLQLFYSPASKVRFELVQNLEVQFEINRKIMPYITSLTFEDLDR